MTDYYLFHQNMHVFDGSDAKKNEGFGNAMRIISGQLNKDLVVAAGFTEIMSDESAAMREIASMACYLNPKLTYPYLFATGVRVFPKEATEYIAISLDKQFRVEARGRVMLIKEKKDEPYWKCVSDDDVRVGVMSKDFASDSRGLAYVCGQFGDQKMIVGFTNDISGGGGNAACPLMDKIMKMIWDKHPYYSECHTIFGGSFRSTPSPMSDPVYTIYACAPPAAADTIELDKAAPSPNTTPLSTTKLAFFYDFWVADEEITNDYASVYGETWNKELSDHCGIALRLDMEVKFAA